jgi:hypothetical protein
MHRSEAGEVQKTLMSDQAAVAPLQSRYFLLIPFAPSQAEPRALLVPRGGALSLPCYDSQDGELWQSVAHVNRMARDGLGADVTTLRCMQVTYDAESRRVTKTYAMENHNPDWTPPTGAGWYGAEAIDLLPSNQQTLLREWLAWVTVTSGPLRAPWYQPGWYADALDWIDEQLDRLGYAEYTDDDSVEQTRTWQRSAIIRVHSRVGDLYFKASPFIFKHEPLLTQWLSVVYPNRSPKVLAVAPEQSWMLMRAFQGKMLDQHPDPARIVDMARSFSRLQVDLVKEVDQLLAFGCPERGLGRITADIDELLADTDAMLPGQPGGLTEDEIIRLRGLAPRLKALCDELDECGLPATLEHGDFWTGNVTDTGSGFTFFDWSDSSVSHPLFSLGTLLDFLEEADPPAASGTLQAVSAAYLEAWGAFAPLDQLRRALELARPLTPLHLALLYHQVILPWLEDKWEMERMLPFYVRKVLRHMDGT